MYWRTCRPRVAPSPPPCKHDPHLTTPQVRQGTHKALIRAQLLVCCSVFAAGPLGLTVRVVAAAVVVSVSVLQCLHVPPV